MQLCESCQNPGICSIPPDQHVTYCTMFSPIPSVDLLEPVIKPNKLSLKPCPLCGEAHPTYIPFENNKGYWVSCANPSCGLWAHKLTDEEWNSRAFNKAELNKIFYTVDSVYVCGQGKDVNEYCCVVCKKRAGKPSKVQHKKNCIVKKMLNILS